MDDIAFWKGRMTELAMRAKSRHVATHTNFLSVSEQNEALKSLHIPFSQNQSYVFNGIHFFAEGGYDEADRRCFYFLPEEETEDDYKERVRHGEGIKCLHFYPKAKRFAEPLTHRDVLGSLMSLGIEREEFGDILFDENDIYVMVTEEIADQVLDNITSIRHTFVLGENISPEECKARPKFIEEEIYIASPRIDAILAEVYSLSREEAQQYIKEGHVFLNGEDCLSPSKEIQPNARISVQGKGKFYFAGVTKTTRKGRLVAKIKRFS